MSKQTKRGFWLPISIGVTLLVAGILYARQTGFWQTFFNQPRQTYQTVNTGVSVQVSETSSTGSGENGTPMVPSLPSPSPPYSPPSVDPLDPPHRMW